MQSTVLAKGIMSVRPSVTFRYCVQTNEDTIVRFSASGRTFPLVSGEVKFSRIFAGDYPKQGRNAVMDGNHLGYRWAMIGGLKCAS